MKIQRMKTNRIVNPLGFDLKTPHVSWTVTDTEAKKQLWARVEVSKTEDFADVIFDTGACKTASSLGVPVEITLEPRTRYFWRVTVMGDNGELVTSDTAWFETAKLDEPFTAQRISPCLAPDTAPYMRRAFEITGEVLSARAYFTGLGIYELYLNGEKANDEYLVPGCTAYDSWIQYQTYDVTDLIHTGENVIGAILGNGWAKGRFGFDGVVGDYETNFPGKPCNMYTEEYLLFGELHVTTTQGETVVLLSHKKADSYIHIDVEFGEGEGKIPVDSIAKRAEAYKPKEKVTYKMIKEYIEAKYGFKVHTAYIAEVKRDLGLPMYDAPNAVEELKQPRKHPTAEKVEAIKDALKYFKVI